MHCDGLFHLRDGDLLQKISLESAVRIMSQPGVSLWALSTMNDKPAATMTRADPDRTIGGSTKMQYKSPLHKCCRCGGQLMVDKFIDAMLYGFDGPENVVHVTSRCKKRSCGTNFGYNILSPIVNIFLNASTECCS